VDAEILRIVDVNANRAREALRIVEDYARFALDDADAAACAKQIRHDLRDLADAIGRRELLAARDILADVGREQKTPAEGQRNQPGDVVQAAFARLTEALRTIDEYAKLQWPQVAGRAERLRYGVYELEQRIVLRGTLRQRFRQARLYVIVTGALCSGEWMATAEAALRGGAGVIQLREPDLPAGGLLDRARRLRDLTRRYEALLIVNDRPDVARLSGADGVHVGQNDLPVREARTIAGAERLVGKSTHTQEQVAGAIAERPDYIAVGPVFPSRTKPQPHVVGVQAVAAAAERSNLPLVAIGGITAENAEQVLRAGADVLCVCSAVISTPDPEAAARHLCAVHQQVRSESGQGALRNRGG